MRQGLDQRDVTNMSGNFHETFDRPDLPLPSERSTGLVFAAVALIVAYFWRNNDYVFYIASGIAALLVIVSLLTPRLLRPLNVAWMRFAVLVSKVMNPIVMMVLFAVVIVPPGLLMRLTYDPMRSRRKNDTKSYWIVRDQSQQSSMENQF